MLLVQQTFDEELQRLPTIIECSKHIVFDRDYSYSDLNKTYTTTHKERSAYTKYNFALLTHEFLLSIKDMVVDLEITKVVELGVGAGWLSFWLEKYGITVLDSIDNMSGSWEWIKSPIKIKKQSAISYVQKHPEIQLFILCWPFMDNVATRIWKAMIPNQYLLYIGEGGGGCTANDRFFEATKSNEEEDNWNLRQSFRSFWGIHDYPLVFKK